MGKIKTWWNHNPRWLRIFLIIETAVAVVLSIAAWQAEFELEAAKARLNQFMEDMRNEPQRWRI